MKTSLSFIEKSYTSFKKSFMGKCAPSGHSRRWSACMEADTNLSGKKAWMKEITIHELVNCYLVRVDWINLFHVYVCIEKDNKDYNTHLTVFFLSKLN